MKNVGSNKSIAVEMFVQMILGRSLEYACLETCRFHLLRNKNKFVRVIGRAVSVVLAPVNTTLASAARVSCLRKCSFDANGLNESARASLVVLGNSCVTESALPQ